VITNPEQQVSPGCCASSSFAHPSTSCYVHPPQQKLPYGSFFLFFFFFFFFFLVFLAP
jgi:hypothetical protein